MVNGQGRLIERDSVKKHVAAIHIGGKLTLLQRKLSNCLLLHAYDDLMTKPSHRIDAETLSAMSGYASRDRESLKGALRALAETTAEWNMLGDDGEDEWGVSSLISYARLSAGVCEYAYSAPLAAKLFDPSVFSIINMRIQRNFTSGHALALYENCFRFVRTGSTGWWEIETFRRLMGLHDSAYYDDFSKLNAKIIKPAVKEVNQVSDIALICEVRRESRKVKRVRFLISRSDQETLFDLGDDDAVRKSDAYRRLRENGIATRLAQRWIADHGESYVRDKLDFIDQERRQGRVRKTPAAYLTAAIKGDFRTPPPPSGPARMPTNAVASQPAPDPVALEETRRQAQLAVESAWRSRCLAEIDAYLAKRSSVSRKATKDRFAAQLESDFEIGQFRRYGWAARGMFHTIHAFWTELLPDGLPTLADIEAEL